MIITYKNSKNQKWGTVKKSRHEEIVTGSNVYTRNDILKFYSFQIQNSYFDGGVVFTTPD